MVSNALAAIPGARPTERYRSLHNRSTVNLPKTCMPAALAEILAHTDELLDAAAFEDYGPNGLQVPGTSTVSTIVTGVSGQLELFERAAELSADLVLVHHGILWNADERRIGPAL